MKEARVTLRKRKFEREEKLEALKKSYCDETRRNYQASQEYQAILSTLEPKTSRHLKPLTNRDLIVIEEEKSPKHLNITSRSRRASTVMKPLQFMKRSQTLARSSQGEDVRGSSLKTAGDILLSSRRTSVLAPNIFMAGGKLAKAPTKHSERRTSKLVHK